MRTKVWEEAERTKQDGTKVKIDWISFTSEFVFEFQKYFHKGYTEPVSFFQDNYCPGLPWFQCWTIIILKNPDAIQNGLARDWVSRGQEFIQTGGEKTRRPVVNKS